LFWHDWGRAIHEVKFLKGIKEGKVFPLIIKGCNIQAIVFDASYFGSKDGEKKNSASGSGAIETIQRLTQNTYRTARISTFPVSNSWNDFKLLVVSFENDELTEEEKANFYDDLSSVPETNECKSRNIKEEPESQDTETQSDSETPHSPQIESQHLQPPQKLPLFPHPQLQKHSHYQLQQLQVHFQPNSYHQR